MRYASLALFLLVLTAACGSATAPVGAPTQLLAHGIVAGNNQITTAGSPQLSGAIVEQLVKNSSGTITMRRVDDGPFQRALDLVVPRAWAQTVVTGSPVVGAVVCAVSPDPAHSLTPFTPCTNTGTDGKATFYFTPGTGAGLAKSEIRGTVANLPTVFDTAKATIMPGEPADISMGFPPHGEQPTIPSGTIVDTHKLIGYVRDKYGNFIAPANAASVSANGLADTTTAFTPGLALRDGTDGPAPTAPDSLGWKFLVTRNPTGHSVRDINGNYSSLVNLYVFGAGKLLTILPITAQ